MGIKLSENHEFSNMRTFHIFAGILSHFILILGLTSCSSSKQGELIGDYSASANCPQSGCADLSPKSDSVYLLRDKNVNINIDSRDGLIEIAGTCSASTYPNNRIEITNVANGTAVSPLAINLGTTSTIPKCAMGQFHIFINACSFTAMGNYKFNVSLKPLDSTGQPVADAAVSIVVSVYRSAAPATGVCP